MRSAGTSSKQHKSYSLTMLRNDEFDFPTTFEHDALLTVQGRAFNCVSGYDKSCSCRDKVRSRKPFAVHPPEDALVMNATEPICWISARIFHSHHDKYMRFACLACAENGQFVAAAAICSAVVASGHACCCRHVTTSVRAA